MEYAPDSKNLEGGDTGFEALVGSVGIDPILAIVNGYEDMIPPTGWLLNAQIMLGNNGGAYIDIYKYFEGDFGVSPSVAADWQGSRTVRGRYSLTGGRYCLSYDAPGRLDRSALYELRYEGVDSVSLGNDGLLTRGSGPMVAYPTGVVYNTSIIRQLSGEPPQAGEWLCVSRAVLGIEEVGAVLVAVGGVMGLEKNDIHTLVTAVAEKIGHLA